MQEESKDAAAKPNTEKKRKGKESSPEVIELMSDEEEEGVKIAEEDEEGEDDDNEASEPPQKKRKQEGSQKIKEEYEKGEKRKEEQKHENETSSSDDEDSEEGGESEDEAYRKMNRAKTKKGINPPVPPPRDRPKSNAAPPTDIYAPDLICPDCKNPNPDFEEDYANGDVVCRECGLVVAKVVDMGEEKRNFAESGVNRSRTSMVDTLLNDGGLRTQISDSGGKGVAQWHSRVQNSVEDAKLLSGYSQIEHIAELLKVPESTKLISKQLFHRFESKRGKSMRLKIEPLVAAIIYIASKKTLPFKHISRETQIPIKQITESYRKLKQILPNQDSSELVSPADLVPRVCSEMRLSHKLINLAKDIAQEGTRYLEGKNPSSIAAASVYLAATIMGEPATPHSVAEAASISAATVHNVFKELQSHQHELKCLQST